MMELKIKEHTILIDDEDFPFLFNKKWRVLKTQDGHLYVTTGRAGDYKGLHRILLDVKDPNILVDHINGNGLDNRRANLRLCNNMENQRNRIKKAKGSSKYKGVSWSKEKNLWKSYICIKRKTYHLGYFDDEIVAAKKYDEAAIKHFGQFARINKYENG